MPCVYRWIRVLCMFAAATAWAQDQAAPAAPPAPPPQNLVDVRQVEVKVWISETSERGLRELGTDLSFTRFARGVEQSGSLQAVSTNLLDTRPFGQVTVPAPQAKPPNAFQPPLRPDLNAALPNIQSPGGLGLEFSILEPGYGTLDAVFRGIERTVDIDLISKPEVLVVNGGAAEIKAGGEVPYQDVKFDVYGRPQLNVTWKNIGVVLNLTPTILPNDFVQLQITQLEVTDIARIENLRGVDLPVFSKRSQTGFVIVPNGQTLVVGGLSSRVVRKNERRVPFLGSLPLIGIPFRSRNSEGDISHLLVFVSPTIVDLRNISEQAMDALSFWQQHKGEWQNVERIEREIEVMRSEP